MRGMTQKLLLAVFAIALLTAGGCASDGSQPGREPRDEPRRDFQQPGFTPFSA